MIKMTIGEKFEVDYEEHDYCPGCGQAEDVVL